MYHAPPKRKTLPSMTPHIVVYIICPSLLLSFPCLEYHLDNFGLFQASSVLLLTLVHKNATVGSMSDVVNAAILPLLNGQLPTSLRLVSISRRCYFC